MEYVKAEIHKLLKNVICVRRISQLCKKDLEEKIYCGDSIFEIAPSIWKITYIIFVICPQVCFSLS